MVEYTEEKSDSRSLAGLGMFTSRVSQSVSQAGSDNQSQGRPRLLHLSQTKKYLLSG